MKRSLKEKLFYYSKPGLYKKKIEELEDCEEKVVWLLAKFPDLRNTDKYLLFQYWTYFDGFTCSLTLNKELIDSITPAETITRCRRFIQNDLGLFLPTDEDVIKAREISELAVSDWSKRREEIEIEANL